MTNGDRTYLDYDATPRAVVFDRSGFSDGYWSLLLALTSPVSFVMVILAVFWFPAIIHYGWSAVRKTRGRSVCGWIGLVYGSCAMLAALGALGWVLYTGK